MRLGYIIIYKAISVVKPTQKPWGQIVSYVKDNNSCLVEICNSTEVS